MRELKTQYRDISATAPISVCRGITPLCAPIPQSEEDFAAEVGGRYSERVYSLWQRLNLFFLEETAGEPVVPEKKVTLINHFTQQLFLQLFSNKQTSKLIREDRAYSALLHGLKQGRRTAGTDRSVSASVAKDIAAAFQEKQILTGDLCGLASVLQGSVGGEEPHTASEQTLLLTVNRLVKVISEEISEKKAISTQNRVLLERIRTAVESAPRGTRDGHTEGTRDTQDTRVNRHLSAVVGELLQLSPDASPTEAEQITVNCRRMLDELPFTHTRAREEYVGAVERVMRMVREQKSTSEIRETINAITNRIYEHRVERRVERRVEHRVTSAGYGRNHLETAKRVRDLLETVVTADSVRTPVLSERGGQTHPIHQENTPSAETASAGAEDIIQSARPASREAELRLLTQLLTREALPLTASADVAGDPLASDPLASDRPAGGVITAESLQMDRALRTAGEVVRQILRTSAATSRGPAVMAGTYEAEALQAPADLATPNAPEPRTEERGRILPTEMAGTMIGQAPGQAAAQTPAESLAEGPAEDPAEGPTEGPASGQAMGHVITDRLPASYAEGMPPVRLTYNEEAAMDPAEPSAPRIPERRETESRRLTDQTANQMAAQITDRITDQLTEHLSERVSERLTERFTEHLTERASEHLSERATDRSMERVTDHLTERLAQHLSERATDRSVERVTEHLTEQVAENVSYRLRGRVIDATVETRGLPTAKFNMVQRLHERAQRYVTEPSALESRRGAAASPSAPLPAEGQVPPTVAWSSPTARYLAAAMTALPRTEGFGVKYDGASNTYIYNFAPTMATPAADGRMPAPSAANPASPVGGQPAYGETAVYNFEISAPDFTGANPPAARVQPFVGTPLYLQRTDNLFIYAPTEAGETASDRSLTAEQTAERLTEQIVGRTVEHAVDRVTDHVKDQAIDRVTDHVIDRVTDRVTDHVTDRVTNRVTNQVTNQVTDYITDRVTDRLADRVTNRVTEQTVRRGEYHKVDMVQQLYRRTKRYLSDAVAFESYHGMGYLPSGQASAETFLPLLNAERSTAARLFQGLPAIWMGDDMAASASDFATVPAAYSAVDYTADPEQISVGAARVIPFAGTPLYLQNAGQTFIYAERATQSDGTAPAWGTSGRDEAHSQAPRANLRPNASPPVQGVSTPIGQTAPRLRGRILPDVSGYGSTLRLEIPQAAPEEALGTGRAMAGNAPHGERPNTDRPHSDLPNGSYRKNLDDKTLRALDSLLAQAQGKDVGPESVASRSTASRGVARVAPVSYGSEPTLYYPEEASVEPTAVPTAVPAAGTAAGTGGNPTQSGRGIAVLRPRTRAMTSDVSEMRMMLRQLDNTARVKKFSSMTGETAPHIAYLIHAVEAGEGTTPAGKAEKPTTLGGGVTFRTVDDSDNMIMLVPPVTADNFRAETGRLRDMPPIAHKEPQREETPPPSTTEKVTLNEKMESSRTVKTQVSKGFEDMSREDIAKLADKVYAQLEARLTRERRRSGF